jgi:uncharacterized protein (DUF58 family)
MTRQQTAQQRNQPTPTQATDPLALALTWSFSAHGRRLAWITALGLITALAAGRGQVIVLAAVPLGLLAAGLRRAPRELRLGTHVQPSRCFEGEQVCVSAHIEPDPGIAGARFHLAASPAFTSSTDASASSLRASWTLDAARWGRWSIGPLHTTLWEPGAIRQAEARVPLGEVAVFPRPAATRVAPTPARLTHRLGEHTARTAGTGIEFHSIRPYAPGDPARHLNWAATARRGTPQVTVHAALHAVDLVVMLDAFSEVGPPGASSLDASVRGACGLVQSYLRSHDRVGIVAIGGMLSWLAPAPGERQFYRIAEKILDVRRDASFVSPDPGRIPRTALPPGALVIVFTPLLDERAVEFVRDLRERAFPTLVVDPLTAEPHPSRPNSLDALALRIWRLERDALRYRLAQLGIPAARWDRSEPLDGILAAWNHASHPGGRP